MILSETYKKRLKELAGISLKKDNTTVLYEREIIKIKNFQVSNWDDLYDSDKLYEHFKLLYELEYKYNRALNSKFKGIEERQKNIIKIIENKAKELIKAITPTFEGVFLDWLDAHNTEDPEKFSGKRFEGMDGGEALEIIIYDYMRYMNTTINALNKEKAFSQIIDTINKNPENFPITIEKFSYISDEKRDNMRYQLESEGLEEFNNNYATGFETEEAAEDYIDNFSYDISDIIYNIDTFYSYFGNDENVFIELYSKIVFPLWYDEWASQGIERTIEDNKEILNNLENIEHQPLKTQFKILNIAINATHQTGDMMDNYENKHSISKKQLDALSETDVSDWDKELKLIGFNIQ